MNYKCRCQLPGFVGLALLSFLPAIRAATTAPSPAVVTLNTPRTFPEIKSKALWEARARDIREQVLVSCGLWPQPEKAPLKTQIFGKSIHDGYSVEKVYLQTYPGYYLAGNLYRPISGKGPFPGVLCPHGHWTEGRLVDQADGSVRALCIGFARQGMVAFAYDMAGYNDTHFADADLAAKVDARHRTFGTNRTDLLWNISTMGLQTWNSVRALDFLASLPDVDKKRLACTGASGGGTQTFMLGAIDDRLAAQAPVVMVSHTMQGGCLCENAPGLRVEYSNMEIAAAAAPRPQILVAATGDWTKDTPMVEGPAIEGIYRLLGKADQFRYVRFDFGHNYNQTSREAVCDCFGKWLLKRKDVAPLKEEPYQKLPDAQLRVFPDGKLPADAMTKEQFTESLKEAHRKQWAALVPKNKEGFEKFKSVVLPLWRHTLQVEWPQCRFTVTELSFRQKIPGAEPGLFLGAVGEEEGGVLATLFDCRNTRLLRNQPTLVVLADPTGAGWFDTNNAPIGLVKQLSEGGSYLSLLDHVLNGGSDDQFANFFTTYNRTRLQLEMRNVLFVCDYTKSRHLFSRVVLCGSGRAGLCALLAAPAADAVVADCSQLDTSSDEALLAPDLFCPGIRNIGTFEGAAMLAAPHPLLLHNTGDKFSTDAIRATYKALGYPERLRIESRRLTDSEIADWISGLK